ncbi:hypothetical protein H8E07_06080 [bacterium]|nr:hypothetical protein [bacterium]
MDASECTWCGAEIESGGVPFKGKIFCSTDCKEDWDDDNVDVEKIDLDEFEERDVMTDELEEFEGELPDDVEDEF